MAIYIGARGEIAEASEHAVKGLTPSVVGR
ncbi:MAG: hypothetical protein JWN09_1730 [Microbacteriaceae bacterium]|jgi:hypothetical protein|nr:hypothetical protein [Microbacteriaceae bacterium]